MRKLGRLWRIGVFVGALAGCQEVRDTVLPSPPTVETSAPFAKSAPQLSPTNHKHAWKRPDCTTCHIARLIEGHTTFSPDRCVKCHGVNGVGTADCAFCHDVPNKEGYPSTGLHAFHVVEKKNGCSECHTGNIHRNGAIEVQMGTLGKFVRTESEAANIPLTDVFVFPGCTESRCHEPRGWKSDTCDTCHPTPPNTLPHSQHLSAKKALTCRDCHANAPHDRSLRTGNIEVGGAKWLRWDAFTGTCESECHSKAKQWDCQSCHGYPPRTGAHVKHVVEYHIECRVCHSNHLHSFQAAVSPNDAAETVKVSFLFLRGTWNKRTDTCLNTGCHDDRSWR